MKTESAAVTKLYDVILWYIPIVEKYPRDYKFTLGDRIIGNLLDSLDLLVEAVYTKDRQHLLRRCNLNLEKLRYQTRLSKDLQAISIKKYEYAAREIDELGKMVGGWMRTTPHNPPLARGEDKGGG